MKKRFYSLILAIAICLSIAVLPASAAGADEYGLAPSQLENIHYVTSEGRYSNWAGVSSVCQFSDEKGRFCFAYCEENKVVVVKTENGKVAKTLQIPKQYPLLGTALCDSSGNLYLVWGRENTGSDTSVNTIFVSKYSSSGALMRTVGGNGSEGLESYYKEHFRTKIPFDGGNCDAAISGNILLVNYARKMYSGHQSNGIFAVNLDTMTVNDKFKSYNSHSFDQRVTPYRKTGGFLIQSHGDCFPRGFCTAVTDKSSTKNEFESFNFWVDENAYADFNMSKLNRTYARLGNILDTGAGAALVAASARDLSENAKTQPYDLFVQVFDPTGKPSDPGSYVTEGSRSGLAGNNGDQQVTDYGVKWLTDLAGSGKTIDVVQAVTNDKDQIVVLYELYSGGAYDSTEYMVLDKNGGVLRPAESLGQIRLNKDEDPVFAGGAVSWVSNAPGSVRLTLYRLGEGIKPDAGTSSAGINPEKTGTAYESNVTVTVGSEQVQFKMYMLKDEMGGETNYIKLRDLAYWLDGTEAQFNVKWDSKLGAISLEPGKSYTDRNGQENSSPYSGDQPYEKSSSLIFIDGLLAELAAFSLDNGSSNYFKLRDLGRALGFNVGWSPELGLFVQPDLPYSEAD